MNTDITYRDCTPADVPAVLRFWKEAGTVPSATDTEEALHTCLRRDPQLFVLAFCRDRLVGSLLGGWDGWRGNLYRLAVLPEFRRKGIAAQLVKTVEERLAALGAVRVYAAVVKPEIEPAATAFWESVGYEISPRVAPYARTLRPSGRAG